MKKELAVGIKKVLKKYGCKGNIGVKNHMSLYVDVMEESRLILILVMVRVIVKSILIGLMTIIKVSQDNF